jgi:hypothetical protein
MFQWKKKRNKTKLISGFVLAVLCCLAVSWLLSTRIGAAYEYESYSRRDPFVPLVGVSERGATSGIEGILTIEDVMLQGILIADSGKPGVIINGEIMREGDRVGRLSIESIGSNVVKIKIDDESFELKLYEEKP